MIRTLATLFLVLGLNLSVFSQVDGQDYISNSFGYSVIDEMLPEGFDYVPFTMLTAFPVYRKGLFSLYSELQLTQAINSLELENEYEFGANLGIMLTLPVSEPLVITAAIGAGPHYITIETRHQAQGFIFSDNFEAGMIYNIKSIDTALNARIRYRHISNAGLERPNRGIDNFFLVFGISKAWK